MATINTGTGGFAIDGKVYSFDPKDPSTPESPPLIEDKGDIHVDNSKKDIGKNTKLTIGSFLSNQTKKNYYPVDTEHTEVSLSDQSGLPVNITSTQNSAHFANLENNISTGNNLKATDLSRDADKTINPIVGLQINKGKSSNQFPNGNDLLKSVTENNVSPPIKEYYKSALANNRFSNASLAFANVDIQNPTNEYNPVLNHPTLGQVTANRLAQVGSILSLRSSAELNSSANKNNPSSFTSEAGSLLPSLNQIGTSRVDLITLQASDVLKSLTTDEIPDTSFLNISPGGSWGSLNNIHDRFSGINSIAMIGLSTVLTAGVLLTYEGLNTIIGLINVGPKTLGIVSDGTLVLGSSTANKRVNPNAFPPDLPPNISNLLGIQSTVNDFKACVQVGIAAFFGANDEGGLLGTVTSAVVSSTSSPGFNVVIARTIIRSGVTIVDAFKSIGGNPISIAQGILGIIETIRGSKIISAMNVFAALGDQLLLDKASNAVVSEPGSPVKKSSIDQLSDDEFASAVKKNRLRGTKKLAWSNNRSISSYLLPEATAGLSLMMPGLGSTKMGLGAKEDRARVVYRKLIDADIKLNGARIPYDSSDPNVITVRSVEKQLEAEYVPFYFHDLRTNEIISFHAFLNTLTDDFQADWESSGGIGRIDPVYIYKNTTRRINLSFIAVATSKSDFDDLWIKINKLITLVYPQYTSGRTLITKDNKTKFIQPFSQLVGASPLIRMRIGDLIQSNYSRFNLARLFGADSNEMRINSETETIDFQNVLSDFQKKLKELKINKDTSVSWLLQTDGLPLAGEGLSAKISLPSVPVIGSPGSKPKSPEFANNFYVTDIKFFKFKIVSKIDNNLVNVEANLLSDMELQEQFDIDVKTASLILKGLSDRYNSDDNRKEKVVGGHYQTHIDNLIPTFETIKRVKSNIASNSSKKSIDSLNEFMNPKNNALVKSFQEAGGKGLAGKIDNLNFDWLENTTWETEPGQRAPKMFKITLSYSPIHDISPGLDTNGYNRAPVYPVGGMAMSNDDSSRG